MILVRLLVETDNSVNMGELTLDEQRLEPRANTFLKRCINVLNSIFRHIIEKLSEFVY